MSWRGNHPSPGDAPRPALECAAQGGSSGMTDVQPADEAPSLHDRLGQAAVTHYGALYTVAWLVVRHREDAEDAVVEGVASALAGARARPTREIVNPLAYLKQCVVNKARDMRRPDRGPTRFEVGTEDGGGASLPASEVSAVGVDERELLPRAMHRLTLEEELLLVLRFTCDMAPQTMAALFDMSDVAMRKRLSRALERLRLRYMEVREEDQRRGEEPDLGSRRAAP